jgi:hypothetical protein
MMAKVALLLDRTAAVAVRTSDLALGDLALERGDRVLAVSKLHNVIAFCPDMIEVQHDRIAFSAVHTSGALEVVDDELQVPLPQGTALASRPPVGVNPPRACPQLSSAAMAIGAHEFAVGDLLDDLAQAVALSHEKAHLGSFWSNMIELEHERIGETAVSAAPR